MRVIEVKTCRFCQGYGVKASRGVYDRQNAIINLAVRKFSQKSGPMPRLDVMVSKFRVGKPKCSFCDGSGVWAKETTPES